MTRLLSRLDGRGNSGTCPFRISECADGAGPENECLHLLGVAHLLSALRVNNSCRSRAARCLGKSPITEQFGGGPDNHGVGRQINSIYREFKSALEDESPRKKSP